MKILICGSRNWKSYAAIKRELRKFPRGAEIIHGDARGADKMAATIARGLGIPETGFPANWRLGRGAGHIRNSQMLDEKPDLVIAFQINGSKGTQNTIDEARKRGIPVEVHSFSFRP